MGRDKRSKLHPYAVLGEMLARELDSQPARFSWRRKRLRQAMRARLALQLTEPRDAPQSRTPAG